MSIWTHSISSPLQWAIEACNAMINRYTPEELPPANRWHYHQGVFLHGMEKLFNTTGDSQYLQYVKDYVDLYVSSEGHLEVVDHLDDLMPGRLLLFLDRHTSDDKYRIAAQALREMLPVWRTTSEGGFWHKDIYPNQMWLDGIYMHGPFAVTYAHQYGDPELFDLAVNQALMMERYMKDEKTQLLFHAWDSSGQAKWADPVTKCSPELWGRSVGWYGTALVDMLDILPEEHPERKPLIDILQNLIEAICRYQDDREGLWYQVLDKGEREDNWLELSCSTLFVYIMAKSYLKGYVGGSYIAAIRKGYAGVIKRISFNSQGLIQIPDICIGTGVGDYVHYIQRERCINDLHGVATFVHMCLAVEELEQDQATRSLKPDAIVDGSDPYKNKSEHDSCNVFPTIQSAVDAAPSDLTAPYVILINKGRYVERVNVNKPFITLLGDSRDETVITYDIASDTLRADGTAYGTYETATVTVTASSFSAIDITIENSFDFPANSAKSDDDPTRYANPQAVALKTGLGSMRAEFIRCKLLGYQDTLFANSGTQYYYQCCVAGHIDFIFGAGQAVFEDCDIVSLDMGSSTDNGYITAASTPLSADFGFLFTGCRLLKGSPSLADGTVALGRPWHPTVDLPDGTQTADPEAIGSVLFTNCYMESHILTKGWESMHARDKNKQPIRFYPEDARFYEYINRGPGAIHHSSRRQLSSKSVEDYSIAHVLDGWYPSRLSGRRSLDVGL